MNFVLKYLHVLFTLLIHAHIYTHTYTSTYTFLKKYPRERITPHQLILPCCFPGDFKSIYEILQNESG